MNHTKTILLRLIALLCFLAAFPAWANVAPTVTWLQPANNSKYVPGANITLVANAYDGDGTVAKVDFYNGATLIGTSTSGSNFIFTWNNVAAGTYSLTAKATDNLGATTTTSPATAISVDVANNVPPSISWLQPANNSKYVPGANITLVANAYDGDGTVAKVDFYNGATLIGTSTSGSNFIFTWNNVAAGTYSLTAKATDNLGATTTTSPATAISVDVANNVPPSITWTQPANNAKYVPGANITLVANAYDGDGTVAKVDFYNGATLIGTSTSGSNFIFTWNNVAAGTYSLTAKATDNLGATTTTSPATAISVDVANNVPPSISWLQPANNAKYVPGANITLVANAYDGDGTVAKVDFYNGATLIGTSTSGSNFIFTWNNVAAGTYSLTAKATDNLGATTTTSPATAIIVATVPGAPVIGAASGGNAQASVSFTPPASNGGSTITGYTVTSSPGNLTASGTASPISITGLTNGTAYTFTVKATNAVGTSAASSASNSVTPSQSQAPGAPTSVVATGGNAQATVTFAAPASNGGSAITGYTVTSSPAGGVDSNANTTNLSHVITGLANGTAYTFTVTATNAIGTGAASGASNSVIPGVSQAYYIHTDQLDTPRMITNGAGTVVWSWDNSDPFGNNMANENPAGQGAFNFNLRFPGQYYDRETNLHYNINRDYDPAIGRYIQSDPIGLIGGINTYTYVRGNPLSNVDPLGLWSFSMEAYLGIGGGINVAYSNGTWELTGRLGVGLGEGLNIDPNGTPSPQAKNCGSGYIARTSVNAQAGIGVGPAGVGGSFTAATGNALTTKVGGGYSSVTPVGAFDTGGNIGVRASASLGFEFGSYWNQ